MAITEPELWEIKKSDRNFVKDYNKLHGDSINQCLVCDLFFLGVRGRKVCRVCSDKVLWTSYMRSDLYIAPRFGFKETCTCDDCQIVRDNFMVWKTREGYTTR